MAPKVSVWRPIFLERLAETGNITAAAEAAGVGRTIVYKSRENSQEFAEAWDQALEIATDKLELEARRRAYAGTSKPVFYQGVEVGYVQEYSDTLMIFLLKAHRPDKYRDNLSIAHEGGVRLIVDYVNDWRDGNEDTND